MARVPASPSLLEDPIVIGKAKMLSRGISTPFTLMEKLVLAINGRRFEVSGVDPQTPLLWVLRDTLNLVGTKFGCGKGLCGSCTVHVDGRALRSCILPVGAVGEQEVTTIEGLAASSGELHPVQEVWAEQDVPQCGYCQAGQIMSAAALLQSKPNPSDDDIDAAMSGNICRCGTYKRIRKAIHTIAEKGGAQ